MLTNEDRIRGIWARARIERRGPSIAHVAVGTFEGVEDPRAPSALQIAGCVILALNKELGGDADLQAGKKRVHARKPDVLPTSDFEIEVWPYVANPAAAEEVWKSAWPKVVLALRTLGGALCRVEEGENDRGEKFLVFEYGAAAIFSPKPGATVDRSTVPGRIVDLGNVKMKPRITGLQPKPLHVERKEGSGDG